MLGTKRGRHCANAPHVRPMETHGSSAKSRQGKPLFMIFIKIPKADNSTVSFCPSRGPPPRVAHITIQSVVNQLMLPLVERYRLPSPAFPLLSCSFPLGPTNLRFLTIMKMENCNTSRSVNAGVTHSRCVG